MNAWLARFCVAGSLTLLFVWPSWPQRGGAAGSGGSAPSAPSPNQPPTQQVQNPVFVHGQIIMESDQPLPQPISVALRCGTQLVQMIHPDLKGSFQFILGAGPQSNVDMSGQNDAWDGTPTVVQGRSTALTVAGHQLSGCTVDVTVSGYQPLSKTLTDTIGVESIDVGTLVLTPVAGASASAISVTSLQAPNSARKEFDRGEEEIRSNHLESATKHLEKAVAEYDKYAAAWNELGRIYTAGHQTENARQAFIKAITADPQYIPPFVNLATLELESGKFESAAETAGKALDLHPGIVVASFIQAVADFNLNRLDAAEKSAREAEHGLHQNIPQVHLLLADISLRKQDYSSAVEQMRTYLKEAPQGQFAAETKQRLEQIEKTAANVGSTSAPLPESPSATARPDK